MRILRLCLASSFPLASFSPVFAQSTWYVDDNAIPPGIGSFAFPYASIQYAIDQSTTLAGDKLVVLAGTYAENLDFHGKTLRLQAPAGPSATVIVGAPTAPTVRIASGEGAGMQLESFKITGGGGELVGSSQVGGGVYVSGSSATLIGCTFDQCGSGVVELGGALFADASTVFLSGCTLTNNAAIGDGGACYFANSDVRMNSTGFTANTSAGSGGAWLASGGHFLADTLTLRDNTAANDGGAFVFDGAAATLLSSFVLDNEASYGNGGGGALRGGTTTLAGVFFDGNVARDGGDGAGLAAVGAQFAVSGCSFTDNLADNDHRGGGVYGENSTGTFFGVELRGNFADDGGGAYVDGGSIEFVECLFANNVAQSFQAGTGSGGGLRGGTARRCVFHANHSISGPSAGSGGGARGSTLDHCTLVANTADVASGSDGSAFADCVVTNSIAWGNLPPANEVAGANLVTYTDTQSGVVGTGNLSAHPLFVDQVNGDFHLLASSPCIDVGDPASVLDPNGSLPDLGAFPFGQANCGAKLVYCNPKTNSQGCVPTIAFNAASPSVTGGQFVISAGNVLNKKPGLLFHGSGLSGAPFQGGTLCVAPPLTRTAIQASGGSPSGVDCSGSYAFQWTQSYFASAGIGAGVEVFAQFWSRDAASPSHTGLTAAVRFVTCP
ncbi:MAG: hypothetical protein IT453_10145 [Planctomycetes bacterium]|nr:hypothetical protein [Planctomycetota bacterium]